MDIWSFNYDQTFTFLQEFPFFHISPLERLRIITGAMLTSRNHNLIRCLTDNTSEAMHLLRLRFPLLCRLAEYFIRMRRSTMLLLQVILKSALTVAHLNTTMREQDIPDRKIKILTRYKSQLRLFKPCSYRPRSERHD